MSPAAASVAEAEADVKAEADVRKVEVQSLGGSITRICKMSCLVISGAAAIAVATGSVRIAAPSACLEKASLLLHTFTSGVGMPHRHMCTVLVVFRDQPSWRCRWRCGAAADAAAAVGVQ